MAKKTTAPPPAYFLSLSLENVRSFGEKQTIYFTEGGKPDGKPAQWTIILGDNGVGKTTVLKALAALRPVFSPAYKAYSPAYTEYNGYKWYPNRKDGRPPAIMTYEAEQGRELRDALTGPVAKTEFSMSSPVSSITRVVNGNEVQEIIDGSVGYGVPQSIMPELVCYGYGAGRTIGNSTLSEGSESVDTCASLFNDRADLLNPEEWFLFADYRMKSDQDPLTTQNFHLLKAALLKVMEEGEVTDIDVAPVLLSGGSPRQGVRFKTPYGWVRLRDMSLGYQTLVVWLTDFASKLFIRYPDSPNPLEEPAIVLIDEIDLHLHPSWQRKLIGFLSGIFKNTQFIATAHSPLVVQAAGDQPGGANVVLLRRKDDQTIVSQNPVDVRGWRVDQILTSVFYDLDTARSLGTEKKLERQAVLLNKSKLTVKERQELDALTLELEGEPMGSTGAEEEEAELLRALTARLKPGKSPRKQQ